MIPLARPDITEAEIKAVSEVLRSGVLSIGPKVEEFEQRISEYVGAAHAIAVNSGTSGLHLLIRALGIKDGDEVITTPFSFIASSNCILFERAKPVFVDIDPRTFLIDVEQIEAKITAKTKAILAVDVFGRPCGIDAMMDLARRYNLQVIDDACEALGSETDGRKVGSMTHSVFAFYPNKQITTGEGGIITTSDSEIAEMCRNMRNHGGEGYTVLGYNYRMSELHAALGVVQLSRLPGMIKQRAVVAGKYRRRLAGVKIITPPNYPKMSWFVYVVLVENRDRVMAHLHEHGIQCKPYFVPIHLQPLYGYGRGSFPICENVGDRALALPFYNNITNEEISRVCERLCEVCG